MPFVFAFIVSLQPLLPVKLIIVITIVVLVDFVDLLNFMLVAITVVIIASRMPPSETRLVVIMQFMLVGFAIMPIRPWLIQPLLSIKFLIAHNLPSCYHISHHPLAQMKIPKGSHQLAYCHK